MIIDFNYLNRYFSMVITYRCKTVTISKPMAEVILTVPYPQDLPRRIQPGHHHREQCG